MPFDATLRIRRFNPETDTEPHWETYPVPTEPTNRLLDALHYVKWNIDGTLTFRRSCAHGVCGSDAMRINGVNRLSCKVLRKDIAGGPDDEITIEPIKGLTGRRPILRPRGLSARHTGDEGDPRGQAVADVSSLTAGSARQPRQPMLARPPVIARLTAISTACTT